MLRLRIHTRSLEADNFLNPLLILSVMKARIGAVMKGIVARLPNSAELTDCALLLPLLKIFTVAIRSSKPVQTK